MEEEAKPIQDTNRYRIRYTYRNWIRKPDPSGFGTAHVYSNDLDWIKKEAQRRIKGGDRIDAYEERIEGKWRRFKP